MLVDELANGGGGGCCSDEVSDEVEVFGNAGFVSINGDGIVIEVSTGGNC